MTWFNQIQFVSTLKKNVLGMWSPIPVLCEAYIRQTSILLILDIKIEIFKLYVFKDIKLSLGRGVDWSKYSTEHWTFEGRLPLTGMWIKFCMIHSGVGAYGVTWSTVFSKQEWLLMWDFYLIVLLKDKEYLGQTRTYTVNFNKYTFTIFCMPIKNSTSFLKIML